MEISEATSYNRRVKLGGRLPSEVRPLTQLYEETAKLARLVTDLSLDMAMLRDVLSK